jgi:fructokinase
MVERRPHILSFGEVLWDVYPTYQKLGGAPFNFAAHASMLGADVTMVSSIGDDDLGNEILFQANHLKLNTDFICIDTTRPTGTVNVILDTYGKPSYKIKTEVAWDYISIDKNKVELINQQDILVFGTLALRSSCNLSSLKSLMNHCKEILLDLNIRQNFYNKYLISELLSLTNILKLNDEELDLLSILFNINSSEIYNFLTQTYNLKMIITTKGEFGAEVFEDGQIYKADGVKVDVVDTVGSGDAFLAAFTVNYLNGKHINECLMEACHLGAYVATQSGAIPQTILPQKV